MEATLREFFYNVGIVVTIGTVTMSVLWTVNRLLQVSRFPKELDREIKSLEGRSDFRISRLESKVRALEDNLSKKKR